jgi:hypothetical protein
VNVRLILCLPLALAAANLGAVEVYRAVAPDGTVIYSDRPTGPNAEPVGVNAPRPASQPPADASAGGLLAAAGRPAQPAQAGASADAAEPSPRELAEQRARNCEIARERAESYTGARRLYRELPNGEREYLTDAEINEARARVAADVETWCR